MSSASPQRQQPHFKNSPAAQSLLWIMLLGLAGLAALGFLFRKHAAL